MHNIINMFKAVTILFFSLFLLLGPSQKGYGEEFVPSEEEVLLLELINEARKDPLAMAASLGADPNTVLHDLPELYDVLTGGLAPLQFDEKLYEAALAHTEDMIAYTYYSHTSLDGRTYADRIRESGYVAAGCGESLGIVAFRNLIAPVEAARIMFKSIFLAELNPETTEARNILNPERTEAGIALRSGQFTRGNTVLNAFVATLDFGNSIAAIEAVERALMGMLNAARNDPELALLNAGIDPASAREAYGNPRWVLSDPLPPFAWDERLHWTAAAHNREMCDQHYFNTISLEGLTPFDRVAATGYDPAYVGESLGTLSAVGDVRQGESALEVARGLYEQILKADVDPQSGVDRNIFAPFVTEVGIGVVEAFQDADGKTVSYVVVADFAAPREQRSFVVGTVYEDRNDNRLIDEDEGVAGVKIILKSGYSDVQEAEAEKSGPLGDYQIPLPPLTTGWMELYVERDADVWGPIYVGETGANVLKDIRIPPESTSDSPGSASYDQKRLDRSLRICY